MITKLNVENRKITLKISWHLNLKRWPWQSRRKRAWRAENIITLCKLLAKKKKIKEYKERLKSEITLWYGEGFIIWCNAQFSELALKEICTKIKENCMASQGRKWMRGKIILYQRSVQLRMEWHAMRRLKYKIGRIKAFTTCCTYCIPIERHS